MSFGLRNREICDSDIIKMVDFVNIKVTQRHANRLYDICQTVCLL